MQQQETEGKQTNKQKNFPQNPSSSTDDIINSNMY